MDVRTARLYREGQPKRIGNRHRRRPVGIEELRVDQIERVFAMEPLYQRQHGAGDACGVEPPADLGDEPEGRAIDGQAELLAIDGSLAQVAVTAEDDWRQSDRVDEGDVPMRVALKRFERFRDEDAEAGLGGIGEKGRERENPAGFGDTHSLRTSISATAIQGASLMTSCFCPCPGGSTPSRSP